MFSLAVAALSLSATAYGYATPMHQSRQAADAQTSLQLDPSQVMPGLANDGQATPEAGQVPSLTSKNNFINFCLTQKTSLTNGLQTKTGSCNPTPMGRIIQTDKFVASKFEFPANGATIPASQTFTVKMNIKNMVTGNFVNPNTNYYAAPCQVDATGTVIGHSHVVIEQMTSLGQTTLTDPTVFAFFKGLNGVAANGQLTAVVDKGLGPGVFRLCSINACANHQPVLGAVAQHGSFDDCVYFTTADGAAAPPATAAPAAPAPAAPAPAPAAPAQAAPAAANNGSGKPPGTQFITGPCASDADCASGCCGFKSGLCAGAVIAQERDGGCGHGDATPNNNAAKKIQGPNAEKAAGVPRRRRATVQN